MSWWLLAVLSVYKVLNLKIIWVFIGAQTANAVWSSIGVSQRQKNIKVSQKWLMQEMCLWWTYDWKFHLFFLFFYICLEWFSRQCTNIVGQVSTVAYSMSKHLSRCPPNFFFTIVKHLLRHLLSQPNVICEKYVRTGQFSKTLPASKIVLMLQRMNAAVS